MENPVILNESISGMTLYSFDVKSDKETRKMIRDNIPYNFAGVYIFTDGGNNLYVGQTGDMMNRMLDHICSITSKKKRLNSTQLFIRNSAKKVYIFCGPDLMEGQVKWLESKLIEIITNNGKYHLVNSSPSQYPNIPSWAKPHIDEALENIISYTQLAGLDYLS